jgi:hypothetical protein
MRLTAHEASVAGVHGPLLLPTSLAAEAGEVTLVAGDPGYGHVALALALGGRAALASGSITLDGDAGPRLRRRHVALVDVPDVSSPDDALSVRGVLAEELALAGLPSGRGAGARFLDERNAGHLATRRFEHVPGRQRTAWLMEIAAQRPDTEVLVVAHPDRFGGDPHRWWEASQTLAGQGLAVIVQCTHATARQLGRHDDAYELGA